MNIPFDNTYAQLPERFFAKQEPARVPEPTLIRLNRELAVQLSIDTDWLESSSGVAMLAGNAIPEGAEPIAQAYAGHQFGGFVPQLGDGRAILLGAVFTRVAASHIRVGTFQYFLARKDIDALRLLADHAIARHYADAAEAPNPYLALLESVTAAQADLIAQWMSLGFIHGVMNTDNTAISGETIDYGPCAFMDTFHSQRVFSSIDSGGRYAWHNQPDIGLWNLTRFAETLLPLLSEDSRQAIEIANAALSGYAERFNDRYIARFRAKFCLPPEAPAEITTECLDLLDAQAVDFTLFFRQLTRVAGGEDAETLTAMFAGREPLTRWLARWREKADFAAHLADMRAANPIRIPRNHRVEQAIQSAYGGDFASFHRLVDGLATPYSEQVEYADLEMPPRPEDIVHETFCGT